MDGPPVLLEPNAAQVIAVTCNELATNAAKYGALSAANGPGRRELVARLERTAAPALDGDGGPKVQEPTRKGFGGRILNE